METQTGDVDIRELTLWECFDQIFLKHIERLVGAPYGIEGLPLNLVNSACLILLTEQITEEIENFSTPAERYTRPTLLDELLDMGLTSEKDTEAIFDALIEKGYVEEDSEGGLSVKKPGISTAQLLDGIFPRMPGMNLIASLAQTIDETLSGRRDLEDATQRFDQILRMQGVSILPDKTPSASEKPLSPQPVEFPTPEAPSFTQPAAQSIPQQRRKLSEIYVVQPGTQPKTTLPERTAPPETSPSTEAEFHETPADVTGPGIETAPAAPSAETREAGEIREQPPLIDVEEGVEEAPAADSVVDGGEIQAQTPFREAPMKDTTPSVTQGPSPFSPSEAPEEFDDLSEVRDEPLSPESSVPVVTEDIERQIARFEETLSLQCPICKTGVISEETTTTGRVFYRCKAPDCQFISWGKPFHIVCPQCQNPFLVETIGREDKLLLKCPRATCTHWQAHPSEPGDSPGKTAPAGTKKRVLVRARSGRPRKRGAKRRVVRRKR